MLEVVELTDGQYGLRNIWTGTVLFCEDGEIRTFKSIKGARRYARRLAQQLKRTVRGISKSKF